MRFKRGVFLRLCLLVVVISSTVIVLAQNNSVNEIAKWKHLAARGDAAAQYSLGTAYGNGYGVPKAEAEAVRWYRKAAVQGHVRAQCALGMAYLSGKGVSKNEAEAIRWYRMAAEHGGADAEFDLGFAYDTVSMSNQIEGIRWYRAAAEHGNVKAQYFLGSALYYGEGAIPTNYVEAYYWLNLATGVDGDRETIKLRDEAESHLTPAERLEVQERCKRWSEAHPHSEQ